MAKINEVKFRSAVSAGRIDESTALKYLANERNNLSILTMPTLGAFSHDLSERESEARKQLDSLEADAAINVPLLESIMLEQGWSTQTYVCLNCEKHQASRICSVCAEPDEY